MILIVFIIIAFFALPAGAECRAINISMDSLRPFKMRFVASFAYIVDKNIHTF
jgi:hypothetical protein